MAGWIKQWEIPEEHWLRSSLMYMGAWNDLVQMAERKDRKVVKYGKMLDVQRGTIYTSASELADRWKVSRWWVRHFLDMLEQDAMINRQQTDSRLTTIIVRNYAKYQDKPDSRPTADFTADRHETDSRPTADRQQKPVSTEYIVEGIEGIEGIEGEVKKNRTTFTPPTQRDVEDYCSQASLKVDAERFVNYYESIGWKVGGKSHMKDWKAAVRAWSARDRKASQPAARKFDNFEPRAANSGSAMDDYLKMLEEKYG